MKIRRNEDHTYVLGEGITERTVGGLTTILSHLNLYDFKDIPSDQLRWLQRRGTNVHEAIDAYVKGDVPQILTKDERLRVEHAARFIDARHSGHVLQSEVMAHHPSLWYGCTIDLVCETCRVIMEWKNAAAVKDSHEAQVTGQRIALGGGYAGQVVLLSREGFKVYPAQDRRDLLAAAIIAYYAKNKKMPVTVDIGEIADMLYDMPVLSGKKRRQIV
jgi:hypothetical protein